MAPKKEEEEEEINKPTSKPPQPASQLQLQLQGTQQENLREDITRKKKKSLQVNDE